MTTISHFLATIPMSPTDSWTFFCLPSKPSLGGLDNRWGIVAQEWIAKSGFEVVEVWPGKAIMQVVGVEYFDNDLGDYHEAGFSFYVRQPGAKRGFPLFDGILDIIRGRAASYIHLLPDYVLNLHKLLTDYKFFPWHSNHLGQ